MIDIYAGETKRRTINDPVHSHIRLTELENDILKLPAMNRLHNVRSLSLANLVFPGATATRFAHSLGTMHLASRICEQMLQCCQKRDLLLELFPWMIGSENELSKIIETVRLAGLLHDIGHGPFSHSTEVFMEASLRSRRAEFDEYQALFKSNSTEGRVFVHEYYSIKMIHQIFKTADLESNFFSITPEDISCLLSQGNQKSKIFATQRSARLFRRAISSQIDADRMDYLMRDSLYTGAGFGGIDAERLISNIDVVRSESGDILQVFNEKAMGNIENFIDARYKMYKWVVRHHLMVAFDQLLRVAIHDLIKNGSLDLDDFHWTRFLEAGMSDSDIMHAAENGFKSKNPYCLALFDRRYAPTSLLKGRTEDYRSFEEQLSTSLGGIPSPTDLDAVISSFVAKYNGFMTDHGRGGPESIRFGDKKIVLLATYVTESPLHSATKEKNILIFDGREPEEMSSYSSYFNSLNNEWNDFRPYYFSYFALNAKRSVYAGSAIKERIKAEICDMIAGNAKKRKSN